VFLKKKKMKMKGLDFALRRGFPYAYLHGCGLGWQFGLVVGYPFA
jgi:hypothetical protein